MVEAVTDQRQNVLHLAAWYAAGDTTVRSETAKAAGITRAGLRLLLAVAAIEERTSAAAGKREATALSSLDVATVGIELGRLGPDRDGTGRARQLILRDGKHGLRLTPDGRDVANDFARRMRRHLEAVESLIEERGA